MFKVRIMIEPICTGILRISLKLYSTPILFSWMSIYKFPTLVSIFLMIPLRKIYFSTEDNSSLVIISEILMTCMFDYVLTLSGEFKCWSLFWLKELRFKTSRFFWMRPWHLGKTQTAVESHLMSLHPDLSILRPWDYYQLPKSQS